ncbi:MAG: carbon-nitrogen hydrolase family protein, partial [Tannerellaceae bacterium]|nr:carbon-nitrogen hydrolase family protein [Tannerellaceae bacterium]
RDPQHLVDQVIKYWKVRLAQVLPHKPDLILLTEACDRPAGTTEEQFNYAKVRKNQVLDYFASVAKENHCYIVFGTKREENGVWWNSSIILDREGKVAGIYNKNYPTIGEMEGIDATDIRTLSARDPETDTLPHIAPSDETPVFQCDFGKVACVICFDLNFDELREKYATLQPDLILFSSMYHGALLQSQWAYSCQSYFACAYGLVTAPSEIRDPLGEVVATSTNYYHYAVATINLDRKIATLDNNWEKLAALKTKYGDKVTITNPGKIDGALIMSEHETVTADDMVEEFEIELLRDYFNRSGEYRLRHLKLKNH